MGREIDEGWYRFRRVPRGPWIGAEVSVQDGMIYIVEDGCPVAHGVPVAAIGELMGDAVAEGAAFTHPIARILLWSERITEADYRLMLARSAWASFNSPMSPEANPNKPIDPNTIPIRDLV